LGASYPEEVFIIMKRMLVLAAAMLIAAGLFVPAFAAESGGQLDDCIHLDLGNLVANPGEDIMVPVYISDVTGWGVMAFEMEICWCELPAGLLQFVECMPGEVVINSGWNMGFCGICCPNCINAAAAGATPLVGGGVLFYLKFHVSANAKPCMCCDIWFTNVSLYDPEAPLQVCLQDGEVCINWCDVYGTIRAWYCRPDPCGGYEYPMGVAGVRVHLSQCDIPMGTTYTDSEGFFEFPCLPPHGDGQVLGDDCPYCISLDDCAMIRTQINAFDAALILKYLVCLDDLDCCAFYPCDDADKPGMVFPQQVAADVNCTGAITAYDASLVLQYVVGLIPAFPCPYNWYWFSFDCMEMCTYDCPGTFFILGVLKGDVSGYCYTPPALLTTAEASVTLGIPEHFDGYVEVPVEVRNADDISSAYFEVAYNADDFNVTDVRGVGLGSGFMTAFNATNGTLFIAMAGSGSVSGSGDIAIVTLQKKHTPIPVASTRVEIEDALLDETAPTIEGHEYDAEVVRFALGPISPNPFRESAVISYSAPSAASVSIDVYDVNGRLVQTVYSGQVEAGTHQVVWDGTDSSGSKVARGVYFCRMNAGEFNATEKVVLLQ
jgi:hypothetical protein